MANEVPPQEGYKPFYLREKIGEMVRYGYPLTMGFSRKNRELADEMRKAMLMLGADDPTEERARETKKKCNELAGDIF